MKLSDHLHQLAREHLRTGPDGKAYMVPALLEELRQAVTPGNSMSGGGASGAPSPINVSALDLLAEFENEARRDYYEITSEGWQSTLEELLQALTVMDLSAEWEAYLTHTTQDWIDRITAMLWPNKPRRKLTGKKCPACGLRTHGEERAVALSLGCWDDEGNMRKIGTWDIACASCGAEWAGEQVAYLLRALDTPGAKIVSEVAEVVGVV